MTEPVFIDWNDEKSADFRQGVITARHRLHMDPAFTDLSLAALLSRHPKSLTDICTMGNDPTDRESWRGGDANGMKGRELLEAVRQGKLWINLREAMNTDPVYKPIFDALINQLKQLNPGFNPASAYAGILISSARAQVFYHNDVSETFLLHVKGRKRFYVYPPHAPFVQPQLMEEVLHMTQTEDLPYVPEWDEHAAIVNLDPGTFISWPLHAPHRVVNLEGLNVSVTVEATTRESVLQNGVYHANGVMRRMGLEPRSSNAKGLPAYAKLVVSKAYKGYAQMVGLNARPMPKSETTFDVSLDSEDALNNRAPA